MTGPDIACGDEFTEGSGGELEIRGLVRDSAWPYANAGPSTASAIHLDPAQGIWAPRRDPVIADMSQTMQAGGTAIGPSLQYEFPYQQVTITNPSSAQRAVVMCNWFFEWSVNIASGAVADVHTSIIRLNNRTTPAYKHGATNANLTKFTTANPTWTWIGSRTETDIEYLEAGQTSTYRTQLRVLCGASGSLTANWAINTIKMLGLLM